jgi:hypothetical protein
MPKAAVLVTLATIPVVAAADGTAYLTLKSPSAQRFIDVSVNRPCHVTTSNTSRE